MGPIASCGAASSAPLCGPAPSPPLCVVTSPQTHRGPTSVDPSCGPRTACVDNNNAPKNRLRTPPSKLLLNSKYLTVANVLEVRVCVVIVLVIDRGQNIIRAGIPLLTGPGYCFWPGPEIWATFHLQALKLFSNFKGYKRYNQIFCLKTL